MSEERNIAEEESMLPYSGKPWLIFLHDVLQRRLDPKDKIPHSRFLSLAMFAEKLLEGNGAASNRQATARIHATPARRLPGSTVAGFPVDRTVERLWLAGVF